VNDHEDDVAQPARSLKTFVIGDLVLLGVGIALLVTGNHQGYALVAVAILGFVGVGYMARNPSK
jgi:hypothetical protein